VLIDSNDTIEILRAELQKWKRENKELKMCLGKETSQKRTARASSESSSESS